MKCMKTIKALLLYTYTYIMHERITTEQDNVPKQRQLFFPKYIAKLNLQL